MLVNFIDHKNPLLKDVQILGKKNANTLGLFPEGAFQDHARKKWIITASQNGKLLGYLLFRVSQSLSKVNITHLCISKDERNKGVAKVLLNELVSKFRYSLRGIGLSCRNDYQKASELWKNFGFKPISERRSRSLDEHYLTYWWYDFGNDDLFTSHITEAKSLKAVIDANIIIHLREAANSSNKESQILLSDWLLEDVDYYYVPEIFNEILRDSDSKRREETRKFLSRFDELRFSKDSLIEISKGIQNIIPGNSENDISDQKQISETIAGGLEYFITSDKNILDHSREILNKYGLSILRPSEFIVELDELNNKSDYYPVRLAGADFEFVKVSSQEIKETIKTFHLAGEKESKSEFEILVNELSSDVKASQIKILKGKSNEMLATIGYKICNNSVYEIPLIRIKKSPISKILFSHLIADSIFQCTKKNLSIIKIKEKYLNHDQLLILQDLNFEKIEDGWIKVSLKGLTNSTDLLNNFPLLQKIKEYKSWINSLTKIEDRNKVSFLKYRSERKLFPLKFLDLNIPAFIVPIKPIWASHLFDSVTANQTIFGSKPELAWNRENVYYRSKKLNIFSHPARILWYLSDQKGYNRSKSLVACSYLDEVEIDTVKSLYQKYKRFGIYEWEDVLKVGNNDHENDIMAIRFSDVELFNTPIPFEKLNRYLFDNMNRNYTFQSPVKISSELFFEIYRMGMNIK